MEITPAELQEMACGIFGSIYVFPHVYMAQIMQYTSRKYRLHTHIIALQLDEMWLCSIPCDTWSNIGAYAVTLCSFWYNLHQQKKCLCIFTGIWLYEHYL